VWHTNWVEEFMMRTIYNVFNASLVRWLIALVWMVILTILLLQPIENQIIPTGVKPAPPSFIRELYFSTAHGIIFSITAVVWTWTLSQHISLRKAMWITVIGLFIYGLGTEYAQSLTPGRAPQRIDILANVIGASIGAWILYRWLADLTQRLTPHILIPKTT
jgi:VanZ family protein